MLGEVCVSFFRFIIRELITIQDCLLILTNARETMCLVTAWIPFYSKYFWHYPGSISFPLISLPHYVVTGCSDQLLQL